MDQVRGLQTEYQVKMLNQLKQQTKVFSLVTKLSWWAAQVAASQAKTKLKTGRFLAKQKPALKLKLSKT